MGWTTRSARYLPADTWSDPNGMQDICLDEVLARDCVVGHWCVLQIEWGQLLLSETGWPQVVQVTGLLSACSTPPYPQAHPGPGEIPSPSSLGSGWAAAPPSPQAGGGSGTGKHLMSVRVLRKKARGGAKDDPFPRLSDCCCHYLGPFPYAI